MIKHNSEIGSNVEWNQYWSKITIKLSSLNTVPLEGASPLDYNWNLKIKVYYILGIICTIR